MARHELPLDRRTLHGHFSRELEPVVTIDPGDSVQLSVPNAGWLLESGEPFEPRDDEPLGFDPIRRRSQNSSSFRAASATRSADGMYASSICQYGYGTS